MADTPERPTNPQEPLERRDRGEQRDWDTFDWSAWGVDDHAADGATGADRATADHGAEEALRRPARGRRPGMLRPPLEDREDDDDAPDAASETGRWVTSGGVIQWEEPDFRDGTEFPNLRDEAASSWADDDISLPLGAPERLRVRATRAWLARRRLAETDAQGGLLLERRRIYGAPAEDEPTDEADQPPPTRRRRQNHADNPLDLAIAEHQAAADEYEDLLLTLEELRAHSGADRTLIEFYLNLTDRLAALAAQPGAPGAYDELADDADAAYALSPGDWASLTLLVAEPADPDATSPAARKPPTPRARRERVARTHAAVQTRRHIERVSAPEQEE